MTEGQGVQAQHLKHEFYDPTGQWFPHFLIGLVDVMSSNAVMKAYVITPKCCTILWDLGGQNS